MNDDQNGQQDSSRNVNVQPDPFMQSEKFRNASRSRPMRHEYMEKKTRDSGNGEKNENQEVNYRIQL